MGNRFPPRMVALPRPSTKLPAPRAIITAVVVIALVFCSPLHTSLISLMVVTGATATYSFNCDFHGNIWFGPVRSTGGGLPGQPPVSEIVGLPIASAPLTCATRLQYFFAFAIAFICWTRFRGRFVCAVSLGFISFLRSVLALDFFALSFFALGFFDLGFSAVGFFRHCSGCCGRSIRCSTAWQPLGLFVLLRRLPSYCALAMLARFLGRVEPIGLSFLGNGRFFFGAPASRFGQAFVNGLQVRFCWILAKLFAARLSAFAGVNFVVHLRYFFLLCLASCAIRARLSGSSSARFASCSNLANCVKKSF